jgi:LEA14-like dessication related protein
MKKLFFIVFIVTSTILLARVVSCSYIEQRKLIKKCVFTIVTIDVRGISLNGMTLGLDVSINNPNSNDAVIDKMDLHLYIEDVRTVHVAFDKVTVPPGKTRTVTAIAEIPFSAMGMSMAGRIKSGGKMRYKLAGTAYIDTSLGVIELPVTISKN